MGIKETNLERFHDRAAAVLTALWGVPVLSSLLFFLCTDLWRNFSAYTSPYTMKFIGYIAVICIVALSIVGVLFGLNERSRPQGAYRQVDEDDHLFLYLIPHLIWMLGYLLSFVVLFVPFAPFYLARFLGKRAGRG